ncbi:hypothetical protein [Aeromonas caviae]|uniref:hypothetical protein n=1 Tax=Aeromonas caviae TaxID=648 RepID=UPI003C3074CC
MSYVLVIGGCCHQLPEQPGLYLGLVAHAGMGLGLASHAINLFQPFKLLARNGSGARSRNGWAQALIRSS